MKVYVASSWRNAYYPEVVKALRAAGHDVYDFRNAGPGGEGFHWSQIAPDWEGWSTKQFLDALWNPLATKAFRNDCGHLAQADAVVLVLPAGASAHTEFGYGVGANKVTAILLEPHTRPELMYKLALILSDNLDDLVAQL